MRALAALVVLALSALVGGCAREAGWAATDRLIARDFPDIPKVSADTLASLLQRSEAPLLLDVRTAEEFAVSHLPGALRVEPDDPALPPSLDTLDRGTPLVAYCSVGYRSAALVSRLQAEGFTDVRNLDRSLFGWANEGRPIVREGEVVREAHPYSPTWGRLLDQRLHAYRPGGEVE